MEARITSISSKSLTKMTLESLLELMDQDETQTTNISREISRRSAGARNVGFWFISKRPTAMAKDEVRQMIFKHLNEAGMTGSNQETFANLLSYNPTSIQEANNVVEICSKHLNTMAPAIAMTAKGTLPFAVSRIANLTGMVGDVLAPKKELKDATINRIMTATSSYGFNNDFFAGLISDKIMNGTLPFFDTIIKSHQRVSEEFINSVLGTKNPDYIKMVIEEGSASAKKTLLKVLLKDNFLDMSDSFISENLNNLINIVFSDKGTTSEEKISIIDSPGFSKLDEETKQTIYKSISTSPNRKTFEFALEALESGKADNIEEITANLMNACVFYPRIMKVINEKGLTHRANERFLEYVRRLSRFDNPKSTRFR